MMTKYKKQAGIIKAEWLVQKAVGSMPAEIECVFNCATFT
jgi:hypothetical protein